MSTLQRPSYLRYEEGEVFMGGDSDKDRGDFSDARFTHCSPVSPGAPEIRH